jgi:uncharacterized SAM-binding protein YcdF (DUF218 family)
MGSGRVREVAPLRSSSARRRPRRRWYALVLTLAAVIALAGCRVPLLRGLGRWLDVGERPRTIDCVMVLPGDLNARPFVAAAIYRAGLTHTVMTSRPVATPDIEEGTAIADDEITRRILLARGVKAEDIVLLDGDSHSTFDDAWALRRYLEKTGRHSVAIVTSDFHTRRSRWVFQRALGDLGQGLQMVSAPTDFYNAENWWQVEAGLIAYLSEYFKFAFYVVRYGEGLYWILGASLLAGIVRAGCRRWCGVASLSAENYDAEGASLPA